MKDPSKRLWKHNLKSSPLKTLIIVKVADILGHATSPAGVKPNAGKVEGLTNRRMPDNLK